MKFGSHFITLVKGLWNQGIATGEDLLDGIKMPGSRQALYNLFADDTELSIKASSGNYRTVMEILQQYEAASGAKLNVRKSIMIPVALVEIPLWMSRSGSSILMTLDLSLKGYQALENLKRTFIWGTREDGHAKQSSIAWGVMQGAKLQGGAQIMSLASHSAAVKIRQITKIVEGKDIAWVHIARALLKRDLESGRHRSEMRLWTIEEALLLGPWAKIRESNTLRHLLMPWFKVRKHLRFVAAKGQLPVTLTIHQVLVLATTQSDLDLESEVELRKVMNKPKLRLWGTFTRPWSSGGPCTHKHRVKAVMIERAEIYIDCFNR
ncbi:hypothetical protein R1sor_017062 [Riccia sorocarpa]|uniref:Reverse transcriptase domain-containing protein n=1 Tax=Riccia sorocarpa TaxID=122646 RepID=A0ABD3I9B2_9MARC